MPRDRSNRIEVDLKLLQDKNVERLQEFGKQFDKSIDKLATMLGSYSEQVSGASATVERAGKLGPNASTGSGIGSAPAARMGGNDMLNAPGGGGYGNGGASMAPGGPNGSPMAVGGQGTFEQQYIRAQKRIGEIPVGMRQTLGYIAESGPPMDDQGYLLDRDGNRTGERAGFGRRFASNTNEWMFRGQALRANAMLGYSHVQNVFSRIQGPTTLGQQLGRSRSGGILGGLGSSAFWTGELENLKALREAGFGFDPAYSTAQAKQARQTLQQFGYSGDTSDFLAHQLKQLQVAQGVDPATAMAILDPLVRFGGTENMGQLLTVLRAIPDAAKAAHMNLSEFAQQLAATAQEVAQSTGMTVGGAARALNAFTTTTGLSPSRAGQLMSDPRSAMLASGMTGQSITSLMEGRNRLAPRLAFGTRMFQSATGGYTAEQLAQMRKTDWAKYQQVMNGAWLMYNQNHEIFGGFSPRELINMQVRNHGRLLSHTAIAEQIQSAGSADRIEQMLRGWGGGAGAHMASEFQAYLSRHPGQGIGDYRQEALDLISKSQRAAQTRAAKQITIDLSGDAKKYFRILQDDTPHKNSRGFFDRYAMPALHGLEDVAKVASFLP